MTRNTFILLFIVVCITLILKSAFDNKCLFFKYDVEEELM